MRERLILVAAFLALASAWVAFTNPGHSLLRSMGLGFVS
jgi:hypothetical protein